MLVESKPRSPGTVRGLTRLLRFGLQYTFSPAVVTDRQGLILFANSAFLSITGYTLEELRGQTPRLFKSGAHKAELYKDLWECIGRGEIWHGELVNRHKDGSHFEVELVIVPVRDGRGEIRRYVATYRDITAIKQVQYRLREKIHELSRTRSSLGRLLPFLLTRVERARNRLETLMGRVGGHGGGSGRGPPSRMRLHRATRELGSWTSLLAAHARLSAPPAPRTEAEVRAAAWKARDHLPEHLRPHRLHLEVPERILLRVEEPRLVQFFEHLFTVLLSSLRCPDVGISLQEDASETPVGIVRITLSVKAKDMVPIALSGGAGTPPGDPTSTSDLIQTHLTMMKLIVEEQGGELQYEFIQGSGLEISFTAPRAGGSGPPPRSLIIGDTPQTAALSGSPPASVIVTEDDDVTMAWIVNGLSAMYHFRPVIRRARNLAETLEQLRPGDPELLVLDLDLPRMNGLAALREIKSAAAHVPVVLVSDQGGERLAIEAIRAGASDLLPRGEQLCYVLPRVASALLEARRSARELDQIKTDFVGMLTHDLKNPLSNILGYATGILDQELSESQSEITRRYAGRIRDNGLFMLELISDIMDTVQLESRKMRLHPGRHDLDEIARVAVERCQFLARDKDIRLALETPGGPIPCLIDRPKILQVFTNLVSNAIKFSDPGRIVVIRVALERDRILTEIQDQGRGIPASEIPMLFKKFSRTSTRPTRGEKSTGLGLYIVSEILALHRSRIQVTSTPGEGSCFFFELSRGDETEPARSLSD